MIHVMVCFWNAGPYIRRCLDSILSQSEEEYLVHLIDDVSDDDGPMVCGRAVGSDSRFRIVRNESKRYKLRGMDDVISDADQMRDEDIVVELDGDDHFAHPDVLRRVREAYENNASAMIMNARHVRSDGTPGHSDSVIPSEIRKSAFRFSHLRSWKAGLWRGVDRRYFVDPASGDGSYFRTAVDMAYGLPMLERAGDGGYFHLPEVMVVYNNLNPRNCHKAGSAGGMSDQGAAAIRVRMLDFGGNPYFDRDATWGFVTSNPRYRGEFFS